MTLPRFDAENFEVTVYKYDLFPPTNWARDCDAELRGQNELWNKLVEIERLHIEAVRAIAAPAVAELDAKATALDTQLTTLFDERVALRKQARTKVKSPELDAQIAELRASLKVVRDAAKVLRKEAYAAAKDDLKALDTLRFEHVKEARQKSRLFWPNYNAIVNSYDRARGRALKGGIELKPRAFNGEGRLTNQIQGGITSKRIMDATHSQIAILPKLDKTRNPRGAVLRFKVRSGEDRTAPSRVVYWPFILYRPLPSDGLIKEVTINRRKNGRKFNWSVAFTITRPKASNLLPPRTGQAVAINFGWRLVEDGLRVATAVRFADGKEKFASREHAILSQTIMRGHVKFEEVQSVRSKLRNELIKTMRANGFFDTEPHPKLAEVIQRMKDAEYIKSGHLEHLYKLWSTECPQWGSFMIMLRIKDWLLGSSVTSKRHVSEPQLKALLSNPETGIPLIGEARAQVEQANRRQWIANAKLYQYRLDAAALVGDAAVVIINQHDMSTTAKREDSNLPPPARRNRVIAAPSILRQAVINYCRNHGVTMIEFDGAAHDHAACGAYVEMSFPDELKQLCTQCHEWFDQDENFCKIMLNRTAMPPIQRKAT